MSKYEITAEVEMKIYPVEYEARIWDELKETEETVHGVTFCESYTEATENLEKWYGDDLIIMKLYMLEETSVPLYEFESTASDFHGMIKLDSISIHDGY